jgi:regulator of protease activity HflC (stomatin/prohibitin superfamily)
MRKHPFDRTDRNITLVDLRERSITIKGQEILTNDKVAIRVSLLVYFRVLEPEAAIHNVANYEERIYEDVQLAARRFLASRNLDAILSDRNEISDAVRESVSSAASTYGVEIVRADVKDLVFPGNLREIMNQVLETERRAEAELIEARRDAETLKIRSIAENEAQLRKVQAEKEQIQARAEAELLQLENRLQAEIKEAKALLEHPELLKLKQLQALREMSTKGSKFIVGLDNLGYDKALTVSTDE